MNQWQSKIKNVKIPESLRKLQQEFGKSIGTPFEFLDEKDGYRLQIEKYSDTVVDLMIPREDKDLTGKQRLGTYNQQYWFRLLTIMQEEFPLLRHTLGLRELNKLTTDYLDKFPSRSPSLRHLSDKIIEFLDLETRWNQPLLKQAAKLDYIFIQAFDAKHLPPLDPSQLSEEKQQSLLNQPLYFQPHWFLFEENWNLVELRREVRNSEDDDLIVEPQQEHSYWAIYRGPDVNAVEPLGPLQFKLLSLLASRVPFGEACDQVASELEGETLTFLATNIQFWFREWMELEWFTLENPIYHKTNDPFFKNTFAKR